MLATKRPRLCAMTASYNRTLGTLVYAVYHRYEVGTIGIVIVVLTLEAREAVTTRMSPGPRFSRSAPPKSELTDKHIGVLFNLPPCVVFYFSISESRVGLEKVARESAGRSSRTSEFQIPTMAKGDNRSSLVIFNQTRLLSVRLLGHHFHTMVRQVTSYGTTG